MYLRELHIQNLKLIRDLVLRFDPRPDKPEGMWTVLIGRNGRGKTSLLRSVALAAAGAADGHLLSQGWAHSLLDVRRGDPEPTMIHARFRFGRHGMSGLGTGATVDGIEAVRTVVDAHAIHRPEEIGFQMGSVLATDDGPLVHDRGGFIPPEDWLANQRRMRTGRLFVAAYGNTRRLPTPETAPAIEGQVRRMQSLFDPKFQITALDFYRNLGNGRGARFSGLLDQTLDRVADLVQDVRRIRLREVELDDSGIPDLVQRDMAHTATLDLPGGPIEVPTAWLANGQQALLSWLADLIGHLMLDQKSVTDPADFEGLVLVDDIDLHIHPDWQTRLVPALKRAFPKLQFIVTTHSPLIISSLRPEEVVVLDLDKGGNIVANPLEIDPRLLTSAELYRHVFGVKDTPPDPIHRTLRQYEYLARDAIRSDDEQARMLDLRARLEAAGIRDLIDPEPRQRDTGDA